MKLWISGVFVVLSAAVVLAAPPVPPMLNYQGKLADSHGDPVNGSVQMRFRFYDQQVGGTLQGGFDETQTVTVTDGIFHVLIGSVAGGVPESVMATPQLFLSVSVDGEELTPRQQLVSVPYSYKSGDSARLDGLDSAQFLRSDQDDTTTGTLTAEDGLVGEGTTGRQVILPGGTISLLPGTPGVKGQGVAGTFSTPGAPGVTAIGGGGTLIGNMDTALQAEGDVRIITHDGQGVYMVPGDGDTASPLKIGPFGSPATGEPFMLIDGDLALTGDLELEAGESIRLENSGSGTWQMYTTASKELKIFGGESGSEFTVDGHNAHINLGSTTADTLHVNAKVEGTLLVDGQVRCEELRITGGADLAEPFKIAGSQVVVPGTVMTIDTDNPGQLRPASKAYDRTVAGIISGAGDIKPGATLAQTDTIADGEHPVALTGRVYCRCDASNGPIVPGDLLTTSNTPGHAMKVTDHDRATGAIIGKAMTHLKSGRGLVLVLVTLQ